MRLMIKPDYEINTRNLQIKDKDKELNLKVPPIWEK